MAKEEQLLTLSIRNNFHEANKLVDRIGNLVPTSTDEIDEPNPEMEEADELLEWYITKLYRDVAILAERMQLPLLARRISREFDRITGFTSMHASSFDVGLVSPHINSIRGHFESLATMTDGNEVTGLDVFRTILENTPRIMDLTGVVPQKESHVQQAVYKVLHIAFPDAVREISIGQLFKTYKPDLGVRSLMAAAEYKFAGTADEVRHALDGIYTDMKGYAGHYEWRTFFAVIYTTDTLVNVKEIELEFAGVNAEASWTPIVVVGKGDRKEKTPRAKPSPKPKPGADS